MQFVCHSEWGRQADEESLFYDDMKRFFLPCGRQNDIACHLERM